MSIGLNDEEWKDVCENYTKIQNKNSHEMPDEVKGYKWESVYPNKANDVKYCRIMICREHKLKREQTFGEFYGGGVVD